MFKRFFISFLVVFPLLLAFRIGQIDYTDTVFNSINHPFIYDNAWTDSLIAQLTPEEKIGQLFMIEAYPRLGEKHWQNVGNLIEKYNIGGIIVMQGTPFQTAKMINYLQKRAKIPLLVAIDAEWGLAMRLDSTIKFPYQMALGAIDNQLLIYRMGLEIAKECKRLGIHINFAPVVDINNNPKNPIIGIRSFGENKYIVATDGIAYMKGLQDGGIMAVAKHFPGHGDTDKDSHKTLPIINASKYRLDTLELYPFKQIINSGVAGVMVAHLYIPALVKQKNIPATLSEEIVDTLLRKKLNFNGLIFTDALQMKGITNYYDNGQAELMAFKAGADVLLMPKDIKAAYDRLKNALYKGKISIKQIDDRLKRILNAKVWTGAYKPTFVDTKNLYQQLNNDSAKFIRRQIFENAITLLKNTENIIPFKNLEKIKIASVSIDDGKTTIFQDFLRRYDNVQNFAISKNADKREFDNLLEKLKNFDFVILGIHRVNPFGRTTYGISLNVVNFVKQLSKQNKVILDIFGNPYALQRFTNLDNIPVIVISYENLPSAQEFSAQLIFGGIDAKGTLPVSVAGFKASTGLKTKKIRLKYSVPDELKINKKKLQQIDSIVLSAIDQEAFPSCQIVAVKNGVVFYQKSFGHYTYDQLHEVKWYNIYDIASITKVVATTTALMKLYELGKFDPYKTIGYYLPETKGTNKYNLKIIDVLTHQARLKRWIPFYWQTIDWNLKMPKPQYYRFYKTKNYTIQVAKNLYIRNDFQKEIYQKIYDSPLYHSKRYRYSDLGFYILKKIIEKQTQIPLDTFMLDSFYLPLGTWSIRYNPLKYYSKDNIVPTELDIKFRHQLLQGYVHDYGAAILGGVGGHAGLFANANDLAVFFQMLLNSGIYGDHRFLKSQTIKFFTSKPFKNNRRALGFDSKNGRNKSPACVYASNISFGHLGFTGCMVWADPKYNFIYVFLSNRIYPDVNNRKIIDMNIRAKVQKLFYESFLFSNYAN